MLVNVTVADGLADVWGIVDSPSEKQAVRVAVETTPGVKAVNDNLIIRPVASVGVTRMSAPSPNRPPASGEGAERCGGGTGTAG
ncbi:MAG: BON domain-containing protein [Rhodoplanes sp.]